MFAANETEIFAHRNPHGYALARKSALTQAFPSGEGGPLAVDEESKVCTNNRLSQHPSTKPPRLRAKGHLSEAPSEEGAPPQAVREFPFQKESNFTAKRREQDSRPTLRATA